MQLLESFVLVLITNLLSRHEEKNKTVKPGKKMLRRFDQIRKLWVL